MARWRTTVLSATEWELRWLRVMERHARLTAIQLEAAERCADSPIGIADCSDLYVVGSSILWYRKSKRLYTRIRCIVGPGGYVHVFYWRSPVRGSRVPLSTASTNYYRHV